MSTRIGINRTGRVLATGERTNADDQGRKFYDFLINIDSYAARNQYGTWCDVMWCWMNQHQQRKQTTHRIYSPWYTLNYRPCVFLFLFRAKSQNGGSSFDGMDSKNASFLNRFSFLFFSFFRHHERRTCSGKGVGKVSSPQKRLMIGGIPVLDLLASFARHNGRYWPVVTIKLPFEDAS